MTYIQEIDAGVGGGGGWTLFQELPASSGTTLTSNTLDSDVIGIKIVCHEVRHDGGAGVNSDFQIFFTPAAAWSGATGNTDTSTHRVWGTTSRVSTLGQAGSTPVSAITEMWRWVSGSTHFWSIIMQTNQTLVSGTNANRVDVGGGRVSLSSVLTNIKFDWSGGEDFTNGVIRIFTQ